MKRTGKFKTYDDFFSAIGKDKPFAIGAADANERTSLIARLADDDCLGAERFFGAREDVVATASVREVRRYAKSERMYVRYEFKVLDAHGDWSGRYQLLVVFSKNGKLQSYTIVRGKSRREVVPSELNANDDGYVYVARELKRALMKAKRLGRQMSARTLDKVGVDDTHDRMAFRIAVCDLTWSHVIKVWRKRGYRYRDNLLAYLAMKGDTNAMCELGHWFDVEKEKSEYWACPELAEYWFRKAADAGNPMGQSRLATFLAGDCDKLDLQTRDTMLALLKSAAAQDFPSALLRLSNCYRCDHCGLYNERLAAEYRLRYEEVSPRADDCGRLPVHRNTRYGKIYGELQV